MDRDTARPGPGSPYGREADDGAAGYGNQGNYGNYGGHGGYDDAPGEAGPQTLNHDPAGEERSDRESSGGDGRTGGPGPGVDAGEPPPASRASRDAPQSPPADAASPGDRLADEIEHDLYGRLGWGEDDVTLQTVDSSAVVCFEGEPSYTDDDTSFAVVLTVRAPDIEKLAVELDNYPENFFLAPPPEDSEAETADPGALDGAGGFADGPEQAVKLVVDPEPTARLLRRYHKAGITVVPDARYVAEVIGYLLGGGDPGSYREALSGASGRGPGEGSADGAPQEWEAEDPADQGAQNRRARRRSSLYKTRIELTGTTGRTPADDVLPSEHLEAIRRYNGSSSWGRAAHRLRTGEKIAYPELGRQLDWPTIKSAGLQTLLEHGPSIAVVGAAKGGVGKSTCALNLAVALAQMGRAQEIPTRVGKRQQWSRSLRVLLLEQNFDNACLGKRLNPGGNRIRGLYEYRQALKEYAGEYARYEERCQSLGVKELNGSGADPGEYGEEYRGPAGEPEPGEARQDYGELPAPPPEPDIVKYTTELGGVSDLDVMFAGGEDADLDEMEKEITRAELEELLLSASLAYDVIVVDLDKGRSNRSKMSSEQIRFWLPYSDTFYLLTDQDTSSIQWATEFAEDARDYSDELEEAAARHGLAPPAEFRLVPVVNMWREPHERPGYGAVAEDGPDPWVAAVDTIPADAATDEDGRQVPFIRLPHDPQVPEYNRVGKAIATESRRFGDAFRAWATDFIRHKLAESASDTPETGRGSPRRTGPEPGEGGR